MRNKRRITVELIENGTINNQRLIASFFARKINERGLENETEQREIV